MAGEFDPKEGQRLLREYEEKWLVYLNASRYQPPATAERNALECWLWKHRAELLAAATAPAATLGVERPFDMEHAALLVQQHHAAFTCAAWPTFNETGPALKDWLFANYEGLFSHIARLEGELEGTRLQVESRDRTIDTLLQTLSETEARLPGITSKP